MSLNPQLILLLMSRDSGFRVALRPLCGIARLCRGDPWNPCAAPCATGCPREFLEGEHELSLFSEELWAAHADPQLAQHHGLDVSDAAWSTRSAIIAEGVVRRVRAAHERARALCGRDGARERVLAARLLQRDTFVSVALLGSVAPPSALAHCYSDEGASTIAERLASGKLTVELDEVRCCGRNELLPNWQGQ
jgi:hypothetical protein